jgi:hypothetical protein
MSHQYQNWHLYRKANVLDSYLDIPRYMLCYTVTTAMFLDAKIQVWCLWNEDNLSQIVQPKSDGLFTFSWT